MLRISTSYLQQADCSSIPRVHQMGLRRSSLLNQPGSLELIRIFAAWCFQGEFYTHGSTTVESAYRIAGPYCAQDSSRWSTRPHPCKTSRKVGSMPRAKVDDRTCRRGSLLRIYEWDEGGGEFACCPYCGRTDVGVNVRADGRGHHVIFLGEHNIPVDAVANVRLKRASRPMLNHARQMHPPANQLRG